MTDPSWLLSTMAQSAAALVAIVGGFLVSRVVALSSERQGLERRARDLDEQTQDQAERLRDALEARRAVSWERFVKRAANDCAARYGEHGSVSTEWLADKHRDRVVPTRDEMLALARRLIRETEQAFDSVQAGITLDDYPGEKHIYMVSSNHLPSFGHTTYVLGGPDPTDMFMWKEDRYDKLMEAERDLQAGLSALERERDFVQTERARVAKPEGLKGAMFAFAYLTVAGVVAPVVGLALRPVPSDPLSRWLLFSLFASGLLGLGWYLIGAVRRLSKPRRLQKRG